MPIRNLGPCACCQPTAPYPVSFRITSFTGMLIGYADAGGTAYVSYDDSGGIFAYEITYSDGSTVAQTRTGYLGVADSGFGTSITLTGEVSYGGYKGAWSLTFVPSGIAADDEFYLRVDDAASWYADGDDFRNATFDMVKI